MGPKSRLFLEVVHVPCERQFSLPYNLIFHFIQVGLGLLCRKSSVLFKWLEPSCIVSGIDSVGFPYLFIKR